MHPGDEDNARHEEGELAGAEGAGPRVRWPGVIAEADLVGVAAAVDLAAADSSLPSGTFATCSSTVARLWRRELASPTAPDIAEAIGHGRVEDRGVRHDHRDRDDRIGHVGKRSQLFKVDDAPDGPFCRTVGFSSHDYAYQVLAPSGVAPSGEPCQGAPGGRFGCQLRPWGLCGR